MKPIDELTGGQHSRNIENHVCNGCSATVNESDFRDQLSKAEYKISGFCQQCQDEVFGA